jgi:hypothetical protein
MSGASNSDLFSPRMPEEAAESDRREAGGGGGVGDVAGSGVPVYTRSPSGLLGIMRRASFRGSSVQAQVLESLSLDHKFLKVSLLAM